MFKYCFTDAGFNRLAKNTAYKLTNFSEAGTGGNCILLQKSK